MQFWPRTLPLPGQQYCQGPGPVGQRLSLLSPGSVFCAPRAAVCASWASLCQLSPVRFLRGGFPLNVAQGRCLPELSAFLLQQDVFWCPSFFALSQLVRAFSLPASVWSFSDIWKQLTLLKPGFLAGACFCIHLPASLALVPTICSFFLSFWRYLTNSPLQSCPQPFHFWAGRFGTWPKSDKKVFHSAGAGLLVLPLHGSGKTRVRWWSSTANLNSSSGKTTPALTVLALCVSSVPINNVTDGCSFGWIRFSFVDGCFLPLRREAAAAVPCCDGTVGDVEGWHGDNSAEELWAVDEAHPSAWGRRDPVVSAGFGQCAELMGAQCQDGPSASPVGLSAATDTSIRSNACRRTLYFCILLIAHPEAIPELMYNKKILMGVLSPTAHSAMKQHSPWPLQGAAGTWLLTAPGAPCWQRGMWEGKKWLLQAGYHLCPCLQATSQRGLLSSRWGMCSPQSISGAQQPHAVCCSPRLLALLHLCTDFYLCTIFFCLDLYYFPHQWMISKAKRCGFVLRQQKNSIPDSAWSWDILQNYVLFWTDSEWSLCFILSTECGQNLDALETVPPGRAWCNRMAPGASALCLEIAQCHCFGAAWHLHALFRQSFQTCVL